MKNFAVQNGQFTAAGNFSAYDVLGNYLFIHKRVMASKGWTKDDDVKFPFFAVVSTKDINPYDEEGKPQLNADGTKKLVKREQATSIFVDESAIIAAHVSVATLDEKINTAVSTERKKIRLSAEQVADLTALA